VDKTTTDDVLSAENQTVHTTQLRSIAEIAEVAVSIEMSAAFRPLSILTLYPALRCKAEL